MKEHHPHIQLGQSSIYQIQVQGMISEHWLRNFDNMVIAVEGEDGWAITTLTGVLVDQAALQGLLQQLYTLSLVLLSVERKEK